MAMTATERSRMLRERRASGKVMLTVVVSEDELAEIARAAPQFSRVCPFPRSPPAGEPHRGPSDAKALPVNHCERRRAHCPPVRDLSIFMGHHQGR
jgi:hypothetical protein